MPFVSRTRATLRRAEFGFFGVTVYTRVQTPRRCGAAMRFLRPWPDFRPGVASFLFGLRRPFLTSWLMLGMRRVMVATRPPAAHERQSTPPCVLGTRATEGAARRRPPRLPGG